MCGFAGFYRNSHLQADASACAANMADRIAHRGPDDSGVWTDDAAGIALAHRRLSIVDLSAAGHQPMLSASGRWVLAYNGEVYNHLELRKRLEREGAAPSWRGHSDTETLLAAIEAWGVDETLKRSVGMFALALWDRAERALWLARDRIGEKPLYYGLAGRHLPVRIGTQGPARAPGVQRGGGSWCIGLAVASQLRARAALHLRRHSQAASGNLAEAGVWATRCAAGDLLVAAGGRRAWHRQSV